jgi:hypothetical protein
MSELRIEERERWSCGEKKNVLKHEILKKPNTGDNTIMLCFFCNVAGTYVASTGAAAGGGGGGGSADAGGGVDGGGGGGGGNPDIFLQNFVFARVMSGDLGFVAAGEVGFGFGGGGGWGVGFQFLLIFLLIFFHLCRVFFFFFLTLGRFFFFFFFFFCPSRSA